MIFYILIFLLVNLINTNADVYKQDTMRIIQGIDAADKEFPFLVAIQLRFRHSQTCMGSLITSSNVLTAAHCLVETTEFDDGTFYYEIVTPDTYQIIAGTIYKHPYSEGCQIRFVEEVHKHPKFEVKRAVEQEFEYDVGVLTTSYPFVFGSGFIKRGFVSKTDANKLKQEWYDMIAKEYKYCYIAGFGMRSFCFNASAPLGEQYTYYNISDRLLYAKVIPVSHDKCLDIQCSWLSADKNECKRRLFFKIDLGDCRLCGCTLSKWRFKGGCDGDSGTPLICNGSIFGVFSNNFDCGANAPQPNWYNMMYNVMPFFLNYVDYKSSSYHFNPNFFFICFHVFLKQIQQF